jgi:alpha-beta hydrolase superfamily lysophospholipase/SAM-dependent methyltransferase
MTIAEAPISTGLREVEGTCALRDGTSLFYRAWLPSTPAKRAVVLFHRGHEHSVRWEDVVRGLEGLRETAFFAWDARGHGRSPGERGYAEHFGTLTKDADEFVRFVCREYGIAIEDVAAVGHSVGAVVLAAWVHDFAPPIRAMVLATPAFRVKLYVPLAVPMLRLGWAAGLTKSVKSYVKASMLTHDPEEAARYESDGLISRQIAVNILLDLNDAATRLIADAGAIRVPTLLFTAGDDWVVKNQPIPRFFDRLSSPCKRIVHLPGFFHAIFHEKERHVTLRETFRFIDDAFEKPQPLPSLLHADREGYTKSEYDGLLHPLPPTRPKRWWFAFQRAQLRTICKLSEGVRIGWRSGFDSGESLDHVYRNRAEGTTPLGRLIDRVYLDAIGWRGIRLRKTHLQQVLSRAIDLFVSEGKSAVHVVDIAAGPGRYLLELLRSLPGSRPDLRVSALLRDSNPAALESARRLAARMNLTNVTYDVADAFAYPSLADLDPPPDVAVVSGLYELFPDNSRVLTSLKGLSAALRTGGFLVYTNQPWHPQDEYIARVLRNRERKPWIMRRRTQEEMDELVRAAGFKKLDMLIDPFGIFTVSLARAEPAARRAESAGDVA